MNENDFDSIVATLEANASSVKHDFEIADAINKMLETNKGQFTPVQEQQLKWEYLLFRLMTKNSFAADGLRTERFVPMMSFTDGTIFPDPNAFPDEALSYFETRAKTSTTPIFKARYLDFLWEKSKSKKKHLFGIEAIEQYLATIDAYDNEDAVMEKLDALQRATELCRIFESKADKKPLTEKLTKELNQEIDRAAADKKYRWLIEMFELVIALSPFYASKQISAYMTLCEEASESYHKASNFHLQRHFLQLKLNLSKLLDTTSSEKKEIDDAIGQSFLDEAEAKSGSSLVKVHFLQDAIEHYSKLGNKKKVNELIAQVKDATEGAIKNHEFKELSSTIQMKKEDMEKIKARLGTGEQVPENMGTCSTFFPNWNHAVKLTEELGKKYVFQNLFPTVHYGQKYPVGRPQTPDDVQEDKVMHNFKMEAELALHWLTGFLRELIKDKKVTYGDFKKFFSKIDVIDHDTYETVLVGLQSFFDGDHFQASCILAPQLEDFLRKLLAVFGGQTTIPEAGAFREKTLGSVLSELKPTISEPVYYYISWVMQDYRGFNLRNNVAHGFFKKKHGTPLHSTALLHLFCLLIANTQIAIKEEKQSANQTDR